MIVTNDSSPHEDLYTAAVRHLHEQTPSSRPEPAVGDFVSGCTAGRRWQGRVEWIKGAEICVNTDGSWVYVPAADITH